MRLVSAQSLVGSSTPIFDHPSDYEASASFPHALGPLGLCHTSLNIGITVQPNRGHNIYRVVSYGKAERVCSSLASLEGKLSFEGRCSPPSPIRRKWTGAPSSATQVTPTYLADACPDSVLRQIAVLAEPYAVRWILKLLALSPPHITPLQVCWAYPMHGMAALQKFSRLSFLALTTQPELRFAAHGGYLLLDASGRVVLAQALDDGNQLKFDRPRTWKTEFVAPLRNAGRFQPVTLPALQKAGAKEFCWISPNEVHPRHRRPSPHSTLP